MILVLSMLLGLLLVGSFAAPAAAQDSIPKPATKPELQTALYAGRLLTVEQDQAGALHRGADLWSLRLVAALPLPLGLRLGARADLTSLSMIDPNSLDLTAARTIEGNAALSWSARWAGLEIGAAVAAGGLIPVDGAIEWRYQTLYAGGLRLGQGRSWAYVMAGSDGAADAACACSGGVRAILAGSVEFRRFALVGDWVSGSGGRRRGGVMFRVPMP